MNRRGLVILVSVIATCTIAACGKPVEKSSTTKNVFGTDNRVAITERTYPWTTIGKIFGSHCTGTMVAKNLVLTAAHCVIDDNTNELRTDLTYFRANYIDGSSNYASRIRYIHWGTTHPNTLQGRKHDWAILELEDDLGDQVGWLGVENTTVRTYPSELTIAGYSGDFHGGRTAGVHHNCNLKQRNSDNGWILHDCDTTRGSSGGPILRMHNGQLTVFGINVAEFRDGGSISLRRDDYSHTYGNIAIPTHEALAKIRELRGE